MMAKATVIARNAGTARRSDIGTPSSAAKSPYRPWQSLQLCAPFAFGKGLPFSLGPTNCWEDQNVDPNAERVKRNSYTVSDLSFVELPKSLPTTASPALSLGVGRCCDCRP